MKREPYFDVIEDRAGQFRFRLRAANHRIIAIGEAHTRLRDAWRAAETVRAAAAKARMNR